MIRKAISVKMTQYSRYVEIKRFIFWFTYILIDGNAILKNQIERICWKSRQIHALNVKSG